MLRDDDGEDWGIIKEQNHPRLGPSGWFSFYHMGVPPRVQEISLKALDGSKALPAFGVDTSGISSIGLLSQTTEIKIRPVWGGGETLEETRRMPWAFHKNTIRKIPLYFMHEGLISVQFVSGQCLEITLGMLSIYTTYKVNRYEMISALLIWVNRYRTAYTSWLCTASQGDRIVLGIIERHGLRKNESVWS